jgi:hypothetical protein
MTGDDDLKSRRLGLEIELRQVVQQVDGNATEFNRLSLRQFSRPCFAVDIAANGSNRRNGPEFSQNFRIADVSRMNNVIGAAKSPHSFGP